MKYQDQPRCPCVWMGFSHALLMFVAINGGPCAKPGIYQVQMDRFMLRMCCNEASLRFDRTFLQR